MFAVYGEQSGGSSQVTRSLVSCDEDFEFYSQCVIAMKEQMSKQRSTGVNGQPGNWKGHGS